ncbi:unnamed protein product, partial [Rotaria sp. Silwood1]
HANCFNLKRYKSYLCRRNDYCMNNGKYLQDKPICPLTLICICSNCYYGVRCQFYGEGFSLSLDVILNFEIKRYVSFIEQPLMKKSKRIAKKIILFLIIFSIVSNIHESIHRRLLDDIEEERTWCQVRYSPMMQIFNSIILIIHFIISFSINLFSSMFVIKSSAEQQIKINNKHTFHQLYIQFQLHEHLLISPLVLMLLAITRLISSFTTGSIKSSRNPWLFILGYYISYVSPMITFIIYIISSDLFKNEFYQTIWRIQQQLSQK